MFYANIIEEAGKEKFGNRFKPLKEFIPRNLYYEIFSSIDFVVMNHIRTQAAGNILMFLYNKIPVFMQEKSTLYKLLKSLDVKNVHSINLLNEKYLEKVLANKEHNTDDSIIENYFNKKLKDSSLEEYLS